ncbi:hypothetical protein [Ruminococcus sp. Marseille-P6503]|uniref:hypothetical protein n=1 Tax=Ruminococcus sp. Marseille-P6503 TaxID=2364796 RepID=UPI000F531B54|nr:hypothetical protein [Ruminococcus sp. Marseille-P6503]
MTKNITVTDRHGNLIGTTYPKRAKGLVKNGRAEYISGCEIRLNTHAPIANDTEDKIMSKVIDFNAREFNFDKSCDSNVGSRLFITDCSGENTEVFEIGNWYWDWTQIICEKQLEKNTEYVFRFAMTGGICDTRDETSQFVICPIAEGENISSAWENRYAYSLAQAEYKPTLSKRWGNGFIRIYEIPFNTYDCERFAFVFIAMHAAARIFPAKELSAYADFEDLSCDEYYAQRAQNFSYGGCPGGSFNCSDGANMNFNNSNISENELAEALRSFGDGCDIQFQNVNICSSQGDHPDIGYMSDGSNFDFSNANLTSKAVSMLVSKLGDGCNVCFANVNVTTEGIGNMYSVGHKADGVYIDLANARIPRAVVNLINSKLGDGCNLNLSGADIYTDGN